MTKLTRKEIIAECDEIFKLFDRLCTVNDLMFTLTEKEFHRFYDALHKGGLVDPDGLTEHENNIRSLAFGVGYLFGSGHIVVFSDKTRRLIKTLNESLKVVNR